MGKYSANGFINEMLSSLSIDPEDHKPQTSNGDNNVPPIVSSYNKKIRPILDAVENLRRLNITEEGIQIPSIVVVGDQSSGKSQCHGISSRNQFATWTGNLHEGAFDHEASEPPCGRPELVLDYNDQAVKHMCITKVPVRGQPDDICDQIKDMIMEYIKIDETIILNVLSATQELPTCESIRMPQSVDRTGLRTLAVVTKADKSPEGLHEKVTADDVNIGLGYVCVKH